MKFNLYSIKLWERNYIDLWSVPHVLTGLLLALLMVIYNVSFLTGIYITTAVATLWELFEINRGIYEISSNSVMDIVVAVIGYTIFYHLSKSYNWTTKTNWTVFIIFFVVFVLTLILGWIAYKHYAPK